MKPLRYFIAGYALFFLWCAVGVCALDESEECQNLVLQGDALMSQGRNFYPEAMQKYTEAILKSPTNARALFSRAQIGAQMRQYDLAVSDLNTLLNENTRHVAGLQLRSSILLKEGKLLQASKDLAAIARLHREEGKPVKSVQAAEAIAQKVALSSKKWASFEDVVDIDPLNLPVLSEEKNARRREHLVECIKFLDSFIREFSKESIRLRLFRVACALSIQEGQSVISDLKYVLSHEPQNLQAIVYNAIIMRGMGAHAAAKKELQRCFAIDRENNYCAKLFKLIRTEEKSTTQVVQHLKGKQYQKALKVIASMEKSENYPPYTAQLSMWRCEAYVGLRDSEGFTACADALESKNFNEVDIRLLMAELHLHNDDIPAAEAQLSVAREIQPRHEKIIEMVRKIENLKRNAGRKNYYKILGISKSASDQEIRRAYRKLAKEHHPDKLRSKNLSEREKSKEDELFRNINEAKEILLDSEKRAAYDRGEDPTNPNAQNGGNGPFYGQEFHFSGNGFPGGFPDFGQGFGQEFRGRGGQRTFFFQQR